MKVTRLICGTCGHFLKGLGTDVIFVCSNCGAGWSGEESGLKPIGIEHRAKPGDGISLPFWRVSAAVHILKRTVRKEFTSTILRFKSRFDENTMPGHLKETGGSSNRREFLSPLFPWTGCRG